MDFIDVRHHVHHLDNPRELKPRGIAIHHTVTSVLPDASEKDELAHIRAIDTYHVSQNFGGFGYHVLIFPSGRTYLAGDLTKARAHVAQRNHELIGVALVGDFTAWEPSAIMLDSLAGTLETIDPDDKLKVAGHNFWAVQGWGTECPGSLGSYDFAKIRARTNFQPFIPDFKTVSHALHFAYTGYYLGKRDAITATDRNVLTFLTKWYSEPDLPF